MKTIGAKTQPGLWYRLTAISTAVFLLIFTVIPSWTFAETIDLEGGSVEVNVQDNTTNWSVTGNPVWNVPEFNVAEGSIYNIAGLGSGASLALLVNGGQASNIFGTMNLSNLAFILQNIAGINIGSSAMINLNSASLIASTLPLNLSVTDFLKQNYQFSGQGGFLTNDGKIIGNNADLVALVANAIENRGTIEVPMGTVALAAGDVVSIGISPDGMVSIAVDEATANTMGLSDQIKNSGTISAQGGRVVLDAKAIDGLFDKAINLTAEPNAVSVVKSDDGVIEFVAQGDILNQGTIQADRGSITIETTGNVETLGTFRAQTLRERGASFRVKGIYAVRVSDVANEDGAVTIGTGTYGSASEASSLLDPGNILVEDDAELTLAGDFEFHADSDNSSGGVFEMGTGSSILGQGHNLDIYSAATSDAAEPGHTPKLENIQDVNILTLRGAGSTPTYLSDPTTTSWTNITDFRIADTAKLNRFVSQHILLGYQPWGAPIYDDYYAVYDVYGLQAMKGFISSKLKLQNNIDATSTAGWNSGAGFVPIDNFAATFDGQGYMISGLTIHSNDRSNIGLFGSTSGASITNVGLINLDINSTYDGSVNVGGLIGDAYNTNISSAYVSGEIQTSSASGGTIKVGGLVGYYRALSSKSISRSYSSANIAASTSGANYAGGLVGYNFAGASDNYSGTSGPYGSITISNSFAAGTVNAQGGGLIGANTVGIGRGLYGTSWTGVITVTNSYFVDDTHGSQTGKGTATTLDALKKTDHAVYSGWDFDVDGVSAGHNGDWIMAGLPHHQKEWSSTITNVYQLQMMALDLDASYTIANDIDLSETAFWNPNGSGGYYGFNPVDNYAGALFDGGNHTLTGLYINRPDEHGVGLFGIMNTYGAVTELKDITLENINITGLRAVGGLLGDFQLGALEINNAHVSGVISGYGIGGGHSESTMYGSSVGGLVGLMDYGGIINNSSSEVDVSGDSDIGGLVGHMQSGAEVHNSTSSGSVTGKSNVGGFVGVLKSGSVAENCTVTGADTDVETKDVVGNYGESGEVTAGTGGFVGFVWLGADINNAQVVDVDVQGIWNVGGMIGQGSEINVSNSSVVRGSVNGVHNVGAFVGNAGSSSTFVNNTYTKAVDDTLNAIGNSDTASAQYFEGIKPVDLEAKPEIPDPRLVMNAGDNSGEADLLQSALYLADPIRAYMDSEKAKDLLTDVRVEEGAVYVVPTDGADDMSLLTQGESLRVNYKEAAPARAKASVQPAQAVQENLVPASTVENIRTQYYKAASPVVMESTLDGRRYGTLKNPERDVFVKSPGGEWKPAADGMVILPGDIVKTASAASVKVMMDGGKVGTVDIQEGSLFRISKAETDQKTGDKTTLLDLAIGKVLVRAGKLQGGSKFEVRTPTALTGVRGTVFEVTVKEKA